MAHVAMTAATALGYSLRRGATSRTLWALRRLSSAPQEEVFLAGSQAFSELGVCPEVSQALARVGKPVPSRVQALALPFLLEPRAELTPDGNPLPHVVIGAETGSGKTLAYLVPILHRLAERRRAMLDEEQLAAAAPAETGDEGEGAVPAAMRAATGDGWTDESYPFAIVLVANKELALQAEQMANEVVQHMEDPLGATGKRPRVQRLTTASEDWPFAARWRPAPDLLITMPVHLARYMREGVLVDVMHTSRILVMDEADLLLDGHHLKDVDNILTCVKRVNREVNPRFAPRRFSPKPRERPMDTGKPTVQVILAAATLPSRGLKSIEAEIAKRFREGIVRIGTGEAPPLLDQKGAAVEVEANHDYAGIGGEKSTFIHEHHPLIEQKWVWLGAGESSRQGKAGIEIRTSVLLALLQGTSPDPETSRSLCNPSVLLSALRAFGKAYTQDDAERILDAIGCKAAADSPSASKPIVDENGFDCLQTLVFVNTVQSAAVVEGLLEQAGVKVAGYRKTIPVEERMENLEQFRQGEKQVLVCTDLASRGLDMPNVQQVVELEFALNVVNHLHRQGRAARAGRQGIAYSLYDSTSLDLVSGIKESIGTQGTVDSAFSRNRQFRKRVRKGTQNLGDQSIG
eukprot:scaffold1887_cov239-Pinguiococcus_pyrenoidosus.AAC.6